MNYEYESKVKKIIDGDTVQLRVDLGFSIFTDITIRLARINAPEIKGETYFDGLESKEYLSKIIPVGTEIILKCDGRDKFGRWIGELYKDNENINDMMINSNHAKLYK